MTAGFTAGFLRRVVVRDWRSWGLRWLSVRALSRDDGNRSRLSKPCGLGGPASVPILIVLFRPCKYEALGMAHHIRS